MRKLTNPLLAAGASALVLASIAAPGLAQAPVRGQGSTQTQLQAQLRPDTERQRNQAQLEAERTLDQEAIAVISETGNALRAINRNDKAAALAALERATGKANVLLARNPKTALIPTDVNVELIDNGPDDGAIKAPSLAVIAAMARHDYPRARALLDSMRSEIRIRTYNLPLATYPAALLEAARQLEQNKNESASNLLLAALNTEVIVDRVLPIPLLNVQSDVAQANAVRAKDRNAAIRALDHARAEIKRAGLLGYSDPQTLARMDKWIATQQAEIRRNGSSAVSLSSLKDAVDSFLKKASELQHRGDR